MKEEGDARDWSSVNLSGPVEYDYRRSIELNQGAVYVDPFGFSDSGQGCTFEELRFEMFRYLLLIEVIKDDDGSCLSELYDGRLSQEDVDLDTIDVYEIMILGNLDYVIHGLIRAGKLNQDRSDILRRALKMVIQRGILQPIDLFIIAKKTNHEMVAMRYVATFLEQYAEDHALDLSYVEKLRDNEADEFVILEELVELTVGSRATAMLENVMAEAREAMAPSR